MLLCPAGRGISDDILNVIALRYGASSGHITLENFISLILRFDCMARKCNNDRLTVMQLSKCLTEKKYYKIVTMKPFAIRINGK